ncbi:Ger(x)C family spore germination protein [Paenibacillus pabuli]|uniref:Ger(x)C family spore germination protein n=1 Tax=Paenibacillus pabuli TaxID=1472 RepID=UPI0032426590
MIPVNRRHMFLVLMWVTLLGGCGNRTEMNDLGITSATGFDKHNGNWRITYQVIVPPASSTSGSSGGGSQSTVTTFTSQGKTIREAVAQSSVENPKKLYFAHTNVLVIGEKAAEQGISEILDNYYRNIEPRQTVKMLIADGEAKDYLNKMVPPEKNPGRALSDILQRDHERGSYYPLVNLHEFAMKISSDSGAAGVPIVTVKGQDHKKIENIDVFKETSSPAKLRLEGLSVFSKDKKIGKLSQSESLGVAWLTDQVKRTNLRYAGENGEINSFLVRKATVKTKPIKTGSRYTVRVDAKVSGELDESTSKKKISSTEGIHALQHQAEQLIEAQMMEGWKATQQLKVDLLGIGNKIHQHQPKDWKSLKESWPEELRNMDININVNVSVRRIGLLQDSFSKLLGSE